MKSILLIKWTEEKDTKNTSRTTWLFEGLCQLRLWHFQGHYRYVSSSSYSSHWPHRKIFSRNRTSEPFLSPRLVSRSIELCSYKRSGFEMTGYGCPSNLKRCSTSISFILKYNLYVCTKLVKVEVVHRVRVVNVAQPKMQSWHISSLGVVVPRCFV